MNRGDRQSSAEHEIIKIQKRKLLRYIGIVNCVCLIYSGYLNCWGSLKKISHAQPSKFGHC